MRRLHTAITIGFLPLAACELVRDPLHIQTSRAVTIVHAVLIAGDSTASILLARSPRVAPGRDPALQPIDSARVTLTGNDRTFALLQRDSASDCFRDHRSGPPTRLPGNPSCYAGAAPVPIQPGQRYHLRIVLPRTDTVVTASTVVPRPIQITAPPDLPTLVFPRPGNASSVQPVLDLAWNDPDPAAALHLRLIVPHDECLPIIADGTAAGLGLDLTGRLSVAIRGALLPCNADVLDRDGAQLFFIAWNSDYARYLKIFSHNSIPFDDAASGLSGAIGVFAAVALTRVPVRLTLSAPVP